MCLVGEEVALLSMDGSVTLWSACLVRDWEKRERKVSE